MVSVKFKQTVIYIYNNITTSYLKNSSLIRKLIYVLLTAWFKSSLSNSPLILSCTTTLSTENKISLLFLETTTSCQILSSKRLPTDKLVAIPDPKITVQDISYSTSITMQKM